ncbi:MAG TPA: hypothetical protein VN911_03025 [Candidatus Acidoferrum sp.]|nr:hypothetical protein [Candidatus Acidoferrum sp.]
MVSQNQDQQQLELAGYLGYLSLAIARRVNSKNYATTISWITETPNYANGF